MRPTMVEVFKVSEEAVIPFKATEISACYDVCACFHTDTVKRHGSVLPIKVNNFGTDEANITLYPDEMALIPTGIIFCISPRNFIEFRSRSGNVWGRLLVVANQPATIDADYTKESFVLIHNKSGNTQTIKTGDAVAQCRVVERSDTDWHVINEDAFKRFDKAVKEESKRDGGFGHTGR